MAEEKRQVQCHAPTQYRLVHGNGTQNDHIKLQIVEAFQKFKHIGLYAIQTLDQWRKFKAKKLKIHPDLSRGGTIAHSIIRNYVSLFSYRLKLEVVRYSILQSKLWGDHPPVPRSPVVYALVHSPA
jgi:hypothetical protein